MAAIEPYETKSGKRYRVRYRTPDHRQTDKRGFRTKREAEAFAATVEVEKLRGEYVAPKLGQITVGELGPEWLERKRVDLKPSSAHALEVSWRKHVAPRWSRVRVADVDLDAVERWISDMGRAGSGPTVVIRAYGILAGVLDMAVKGRRLARNPARTPANLPRKTRKPRTYLTHEQVAKLADAARSHRVLVLLLAYTGLRWGEATALRVRHLDLLRRRLTVIENAVQVGMEIHVGTPKSHEARTVALPAFLVDELARQCEGLGRDDLVFPGRHGYLRRPVARSGWFENAVGRAGVPRVTLHDLRHTAASLAVSAGVNVKVLQRMLGHASAAMTLDTYADLFDADLDAAGIALDSAVSAASVGKAWARGQPGASNDA